MPMIANLRTKTVLFLSVLLSLTACSEGARVGLTDDAASNVNSSSNTGANLASNDTSASDSNADANSNSDANSGASFSDVAATNQLMSSNDVDGNYDDSGIAVTVSDLSNLLLSSYSFNGTAILPKSSWVCSQATVVSLYFFPVNTLDVSRQVMVERRLVNNDSVDNYYFWQATDTDAIVLTSTTLSPDNTLLSTGNQFDVSSIRFEEIDGEQFFNANSNLYDDLLCLYRSSDEAPVAFDVLF